MTALDRERQKPARARAGQIRHGMRTYIETLGVIATAYREQDHLTLGYESWDEYLAKEFDHARLQLDPEMREKAITELRLGGLTQRAIATTLGVGRQTVADHERQVALPRPPEPKVGLDGKAVSPARSPLVDALAGAIEDATERAEDHRAGTPGEADVAASEGAGSRVEQPAPTQDLPGDGSPGGGADSPAAPDPEPVVPPAAGEGEQGGPATSPAGPSCEKCGTDITDDGYRRCAGCDPDGMHTAADDGTCRLCALLATVPDEYLPIQVGEGVHGLQLECKCGAVVSHLKAGMPLAVALVEARLHHGTCQ